MAKTKFDKAALFAASKRSGTVMVVPEWGTSILVRPLSVQMSLALGKAAKDGDQSESFVDAFIDCVHDPETGDRIFSQDDRAQIMDLEGSVVVRIVNQAAGVNPEQAAKN